MTYPKPKTASILIASVWILALLSLLAFGIGFRVAIEARLDKYEADSLKALYLAKAAVVKSRELLSNDSKTYDSLYENGIMLSNQNDLNDLFMNIKILGSQEVSARVSYTNGDLKNYPGMMDEERKININKASQEVLRNLIGVLSDKHKMSLGTTTPQELASSIVFWRSQAPGTQENYYESLDNPYPCKHGDFSAIEELLLVQGITLDMLSVLQDYITVFGPDEASININTAPKEVLMAYGMPEALADKILKYRNGPGGEATEKDGGVFLDINDIETTLKTNLPEGLSEEEVLILGDLKSSRRFTTASNYFTIEATGIVHASKMERKIVCVVQKDPVKKGATKLIAYREY
ncbi:MAG: general secretion pathway protein GspK [Candidatus Omnitrophica bacterium]|nr:general secretion pathway protein GspK [Candidatus Omnitrophota bacterium]